MPCKQKLNTPPPPLLLLLLPLLLLLRLLLLFFVTNDSVDVVALESKVRDFSVHENRTLIQLEPFFFRCFHASHIGDVREVTCRVRG